MRAVYIDRRDAELDAEGPVLVVRVGGARVQDLPLGPLERVVLRGPCRLSTRLLAALHERDIGLLVLGARSGAPLARLLGPPHADVRRRLAQVRHLDDPAARARLATQVVQAKIVAQRRLLHELLEAGQGERRILLASQEQLEELVGRVGEPVQLDLLLGLEGAASAAYFAALRTAFAPTLGFEGRNRRPPRDPVNVVLSLGYTLLHHEAVQAAHLAGLDPMLGALHAPAPGRESLACDLVEPLRPHVDRLALTLFRERTLRGDQFRRDGIACRLGKAGRAAFYAAWELRQPALARLLRRTAQRLARALLPDPEEPV
jgi:CRISPR-associated protein Cas1